MIYICIREKDEKRVIIPAENFCFITNDKSLTVIETNVKNINEEKNTPKKNNITEYDLLDNIIFFTKKESIIIKFIKKQTISFTDEIDFLNNKDDIELLENINEGTIKKTIVD